MPWLARFSGLTIREVVERFQDAAKKLGEAAQILQHESRGVRDEVAEVLVNLQFQDRVNQILNQVTGDMERFRNLLDRRRTVIASGGVPESVEIEAWLGDMEHSYTTMEQRSNHAGAQQPGLPQEPQVTFF